MLGQLDHWLGKATEYAESKSFDPNVFIGVRLAPDQFAFVRQVQTACDTVKLAASRLTGKNAPAHPDTERTLPELKARIESVIGYLSTFSASDFAEAATRRVSQPRWDGQFLTGQEFFVQHAVPNFYFHMTTAYSILRHNGVDVGKKDYLGPMPYKH
jgi:hypothetical protein